MAKWEYLVVEVQNVDPQEHWHPDADKPRPRPDSTAFKINGEVQQGNQWLVENIPDELNKLGEEGWQLIKIGKANTFKWSVMYTFKRPL